jgi:hypothetical protein
MHCDPEWPLEAHSGGLLKICLRVKTTACFSYNNPAVNGEGTDAFHADDASAA